MSEPNSCSTGPPKKFLKKGEGLKRFAAFKPPIPVTAHKVERRQTYVKFKLDNSGTKKSPDSHFLHPDILDDESINLSTEVPKIAPPKIMHTPVRPQHGKNNNHFLRPNTPPLSSRAPPPRSPSPPTPSPPPASPSPPRQPLQAKKISPPNPPSSPEALTQPIQPARVTRSTKQCLKLQNTNTDLSTPSPGSCVLALGQQIHQIQLIVNQLQEKIQTCQCEPPKSAPKRKSSRRAVSPTSAAETEQNTRKTRSTNQCSKPGSCVLALGQQIQQIQLTVNELKEGMKNCECGAVLSEQKPVPKRKSSRKTTRQRD